MSVAIVARWSMQWALNAFLQVNPGSVRLFTNNLTPNRDTILSGYTEASYPGYAAQAYAPVTEANSGNQETMSPTQVITFPAPTSGGSVNVYGWWIDFNFGIYGVNWTLSSRFDAAPITLTVGGPALVLVINWNALDANSP